MDAFLVQFLYKENIFPKWVLILFTASCACLYQQLNLQKLIMWQGALLISSQNLDLLWSWSMQWSTTSSGNFLFFSSFSATFLIFLFQSSSFRGRRFCDAWKFYYQQNWGNLCPYLSLFILSPPEVDSVSQLHFVKRRRWIIIWFKTRWNWIKLFKACCGWLGNKDCLWCKTQFGNWPKVLIFSIQNNHVVCFPSSSLILFLPLCFLYLILQHFIKIIKLNIVIIGRST